MGGKAEAGVVRHAGCAGAEMTAGQRIIRVSCPETEEFLLESCRQDPKRHSLWRVLVFMVPLVLALFSLQAVSDKRKGDQAWWVSIVVGPAVAVLVFSLLILNQKRQLRKAIRKRLAQDGVETWLEFTDVGFLAAGPAGSSSHHPWKLVPRVVEKSEGLIIYVNEAAYFWLPKRVFIEADFASLVDLIATKVNRFDRIKK